MVAKRDCSFCGKDIEPGTGKMVVAASGSVSFFCSSKCEKNQLKLKRSPRKVRWTSVYLEEKAIRVRGLKEKKPEEKKVEEKKEEVTEKPPEKKEEKPKEEKKEKPGKKAEKKAKPKKKAKKK